LILKRFKFALSQSEKIVDFEEFLRVILVIVGSLPEHGAKKLENPKNVFT
jgi:hypothetical protein